MASRVAGGILGGLGQGLVRRAEVEREDKLIANEEARQDRIRSEERQRDEEMFLREQAIIRAREIRESIQRGVEREEDRADRIAANTADRVSRENESAADRESRENEVADVLVDEGRNAVAVTRSGKQRGLGVKVAPPARSGGSTADDSGISAGDRRLLETLESRFTTADDVTGAKTTDWNAITKALRDQGRTDLADMLGGALSGEGEDVSDPALREYFGIVDQARANAGAKPGARASGGAGVGTESNPAKPTTQEEFDALPSGAVFLDPDDGKLYRKN